MTPTEADHLLADRLMERRSRAGSVLSDQQAQEVERLLSPPETKDPLLNFSQRISSKENPRGSASVVSATTSSRLEESSSVSTNNTNVITRTSSITSQHNYVNQTNIAETAPTLPPRSSSKEDFSIVAVEAKSTDNSGLSSLSDNHPIDSWFHTTGTGDYFLTIKYLI